MKLHWIDGSGPETLEELADVVEREGKLGRRHLVDEDGLRCLWGVIIDAYLSPGDSDALIPKRRRTLTIASAELLTSNRCDIGDNDAFVGTPEERCQEMVRRLRVIAREHDGARDANNPVKSSS